MKFPLSKIAHLFFAFSFFLITSCSKNDDDIPPVVDAYISIPDTHFEARLIKEGIDSDGIINQQILKEDAEKVTTLTLALSADFDKIDDLTGIEGFVNLKYLSATRHNLVSIDLSKNTQLETLYLWGNNLSSIDFSYNTNLVFVDIQSNNFHSAASIKGLSNATNLIDLDISWNYLEEFSIHNESLEVLHMSHNDLITVNTDGAINLRNVLLTSNKITTVDFSTNISLLTLLLSDNRIEQLNLENNTRLSHLYISSNLLTGLDVSNNQQMVDLKVDRNPTLRCIKIHNSQYIPYTSLSNYQELNILCN